MGFWLGLSAGLLLGGSLGFVATGLCRAAARPLPRPGSQRDQDLERLWRAGKRR